MASPCPLLYSQDQCMNLDHPCHLYPIFLSYHEHSGTERDVKIWLEHEVFSGELCLPRMKNEWKRNEKPTLGTNENRKPSSSVLFQSCSDSTSTAPSGRMRSSFWRAMSHASALKMAGWKQQHLAPKVCFAPCSNNSWTPCFSTDCLSAPRWARLLYRPWKQPGLNGSIEQLEFPAGFNHMNFLPWMKKEQLRASILPSSVEGRSDFTLTKNI